MEYIREVKITIEVDSNKTTKKEILVFTDFESMHEYIEALIEKLDEMTCRN